MEHKLRKKHETFYEFSEALDWQAKHPNSEITAKVGHPIMLFGVLTYPMPEDRPSWTVWWVEED